MAGDRTRREDMTKKTKALMNALRQSINEAIIESNDVAAVVAAIKRTGQRPAFAIALSLQDATETEAVPAMLSLTEELVLDDLDVKFLAAMGISDPSWCCSASKSDAT
jgi:hypothetical protein